MFLLEKKGRHLAAAGAGGLKTPVLALRLVHHVGDTAQFGKGQAKVGGRQGQGRALHVLAERIGIAGQQQIGPIAIAAGATDGDKGAGFNRKARLFKAASDAASEGCIQWKKVMAPALQRQQAPLLAFAQIAQHFAGRQAAIQNRRCRQTRMQIGAGNADIQDTIGQLPGGPGRGQKEAQPEGRLGLVLAR